MKEDANGRGKTEPLPSRNVLFKNPENVGTSFVPMFWISVQEMYETCFSASGITTSERGFLGPKRVVNLVQF
jgi:hypothetical protein